MQSTRDRAWETLTRHTKSESLLRHALAVEAATRAYARRFGEDEELWGVVALLHDFDYEIHPTLDKHPQDGASILREEGYPEEVIEAILSHAEHLGLPRDDSRHADLDNAAALWAGRAGAEGSRIREHLPDRVSRVRRLWARPAYRFLIDPDGRPHGLRRSGRF